MLELERFQTPKERPEPEQHNDYEQREVSNPLWKSMSSPEPGSNHTEKTLHRQPSRTVAAETLRSRPKKLRKSLIANLIRWFCSVLFVVAIYIVLWNYSHRDVMSTPTKREFNALIIGLSLGLGMCITISLEAMAVEIRYWILSLRNWTDYEVC